MTKLYMAPLEGITGYIFRNALFDCFGEGIDRFYTPFLMPHVKRAFTDKEINDIMWEHNSRMNVVPQVMTIVADDFNRVKPCLRDMGYAEININLGCPSRTVASKGRGAGALGNLEALDRFLDGVFADGDKNISVKSRIGIYDPEEFGPIMEIYNKYPIKELTIHPRVLREVYGGVPHVDIFERAFSESHMPVCYNGDVRSVSDYRSIVERFNKDDRQLSGVMIGRGALGNPGLFREIATGRIMTNEEVAAFLDRLLCDYSKVFFGQTPVLFKMKEMWSFLKEYYSEDQKVLKKLMKSKTIEEYKIYEKMILGV